jgi:hypothetical protein
VFTRQGRNYSTFISMLYIFMAGWLWLTAHRR